MGDAQDNFGNACELIKAGLLRAGAPRSSASISGGAAGGSAYYGKVPTEAEAFIKAGLQAAGLPPIRTGLLDNTDANAKAIGDKLAAEVEARIEAAKPYQAAEPQLSGEAIIRKGLGAARHRDEAAAHAKADAAPKVRRSWK